jgi:hypothetical protein
VTEPIPHKYAIQRKDIAIAVLLAFVFRLCYLLLLDRAIDMADSIHYINMGVQFSGGDALQFDENLPVLYSIFGALVHIVISNWEWAFWCVSLIASALIVIPVYYLAFELHGIMSARISALLVAIWPWLIDYGSRIAPEALAVTLWFTSIYLLYRAMNSGGVFLWIAPLSFAALHLTRPEGTFMMLASPIAAGILVAKTDREQYKRWIQFTVTAALLLIVYALVMKVVIGTATISYRAPMAGDTVDYFRRGAVDMAKTFLQMNFNVIPVMLGPFLLVFWGLGFFRPLAINRNVRLEAVILFFCLLQWSLALAAFSPAPRYLMTVVIALSLWSAKGIEQLTLRAALNQRFAWLKFVPVLLVVGTMLLGTVSEIAAEKMGEMPRTPKEYRIAGNWLKEHHARGLIISRKPQIGFYANMPTMGPSSDATPESLIEYVKETGARYVALDERYSAGLIPGLNSLLFDPKSNMHFELLRDDVSPYPGAKVVLYRVVTPGIEYLSEDEFPKTRSHMGPDQQRRSK